MDKRLRDLRRAIGSECDRIGVARWSIETTGSGHYRLTASTGSGRTARVIISVSPRTTNAARATISELRRQLRGE